MKRIVGVFLVILGYSLSLNAHPLKLSVTDIAYKGKKITVKAKLFLDDFNACYSNYIKKGFDFVMYENKEIDMPTQKKIAQYVQQNLIMYIDGKLVHLNLKRAFIDQEKLFTDFAVIYVEMEAKWPTPKIKNIKVKNTLMFESIPEQKNIVNVKFWEDKAPELLQFENEEQVAFKEIQF